MRIRTRFPSLVSHNTHAQAHTLFVVFLNPTSSCGGRRLGEPTRSYRRINATFQTQNPVSEHCLSVVRKVFMYTITSHRFFPLDEIYIICLQMIDLLSTRIRFAKQYILRHVYVNCCVIDVSNPRFLLCPCTVNAQYARAPYKLSKIIHKNCFVVWTVFRFNAGTNDKRTLPKSSNPSMADRPLCF